MSVDDIRIPVVEWLQSWDMHNVGVDAKRSYAEQELLRIKAQGMPLLFAALSTGLPDQCDTLVSLLREMSYTPMLRLRPGASPPPFDAQGRTLPPAKRGKVLVTKSGVIGQMDASELKTRNAETARFAGSARDTLALQRGLYRVIEITEEPKAVSLDDAIVVLRQWGVGLVNKRMHKKGTRDKWLVIENSPLWNDCFEQPLTPPEPDATPDAEPSKRKKAA